MDVNTNVPIICHCTLYISYACEMEWICFDFWISLLIWVVYQTFAYENISKTWKCLKPKHFWVPNFLFERYATCEHWFSKLRSISYLCLQNQGKAGKRQRGHGKVDVSNYPCWLAFTLTGWCYIYYTYHKTKQINNNSKKKTQKLNYRGTNNMKNPCEL